MWQIGRGLENMGVEEVDADTVIYCHHINNVWKKASRLCLVQRILENCILFINIYKK